MTYKDFTPLSSGEVLGGLSGRHNKRAATLLFAIESRTAHLVAHSKQALELSLTEEIVGKHNLAFLEALSRGRSLPFNPTIQDLERYASQWAPLVPKNPQLQAAVAHLLSQKHEFTFRSIPGIRTALGFDEKTVQEVYQRQHHRALETIFAPQMTLSDRLRWRRAGLARWLEELPPFWIAFALTLTSIIGVGILALPIALASLGPLLGVLLLVILGLANVFTIAFMAEAATRTGSVRYGKTFLGRMVADYLGPQIASIFSIGLFIYCGLGVMAYYFGFSLTLEDVTHIPAGIWMGGIFLAGIYVVWRKSLNATVASALLVGAINVSLILIFSFFAFKHSQPANLLYVRIPFLDGQPFEASGLRLVFGVIMTAYLGHLSVSNCAQVVLRRDPGGRALLWGTIAAQITALVLYCIWVLAVNGAIAPQILAAESGTSLIPLAAAVGPVIKILGTIFVLLALGMASIHPSLILFNLTHEWLPGKPKGSSISGQKHDQMRLAHRKKGRQPSTEFSQMPDSKSKTSSLEQSGPFSSVRALIHRVTEVMFSERGRTIISVSPLVVVFLIAEWLLVSGIGSFTALLNIRGILMTPLLSGILPIILVKAGRCKGELMPATASRLLHHPVIMMLLYIFFLSSLFLYGVIIWEAPLKRIAALMMGFLVIGLMIVINRQGGFAPRIVVELRNDQREGGQSLFNIMAAGIPMSAKIHLEYDNDEQQIQAASGTISDFTALRCAHVHLPARQVQELKVWVHTITPEGDSESLPVLLTVSCEHKEKEYDLRLFDGHVVLPVTAEACRLELRLMV